MKKEKISKALHGIDESYIEKAATYRKKKMAAPMMKWGAIAASLALIIAGTAIAMPHLTSTQAGLPTMTDTTNPLNFQETDEETIGWEDTITEETAGGTGISYGARVEEGTFAKYLPMAVIEESAVGEKLADVSVKAYWHDMNITFEDAEAEAETVEHLRAEVYAIKGVSSAAAVCVKYLDQGDALTTTHYYTFVNTEAKAETLAEFFADLNANAYFSVKAANAHVSRLAATAKENEVYLLNGENTSTLRAKLLALDGAAMEYTKKDTLATLLKSCRAQANIPIDFDSLGSYSAGALVLDNGYLIFNIFSTNEFAFAFEIGEEKAKALIAYVEENAEKKVYADGETVMVETMSESTKEEIVYE